ncbi:hypothetical protein SPRG_13777 [Saprolegnia parasitica CBS 223.65]|uniref:Uncharacterized protein n=1 Tax=Saprolegnia parasitica (strain CBS 223.65) TaxID=695850 RepID=A0A067BU78_SAPPC|nr:hypothetical protein SPRG_13777 [Saprolegnia parasitica CBS 223.65]KDO20395.1 hypothetical protein SPRG_13777 [Saprolegnia parasitica CBS 223.65]|eukprot:XP_012208920.1 hypothetical protein SPRG_13777 [Saprolegnia parasitica CBS 223.65]
MIKVAKLLVVVVATSIRTETKAARSNQWTARRTWAPRGRAVSACAQARGLALDTAVHESHLDVLRFYEWKAALDRAAQLDVLLTLDPTQAAQAVDRALSIRQKAVFLNLQAAAYPGAKTSAVLDVD